MERTLVIIKPDAIRNKDIGKIISMYEENGLRVQDMYMTFPDRDKLEKLYIEHVDKEFYHSLVEFMENGPIIPIVVAGENAVEIVREINGATDPSKARPGTIRYLFGKTIQQNAVHASESKTAAKKELNIWFDIDFD
jgi:nucleoside-diphosphate kinase